MSVRFFCLLLPLFALIACAKHDSQGAAARARAATQSSALDIPLGYLGVNLDNTVWNDQTHVFELFQSAVGLGTNLVRLPAPTDISDFGVNAYQRAQIEAMVRINAAGGKILLLVLPEALFYEQADRTPTYADSTSTGGPFQKKCGWSQGQLKISAINNQRFNTKLEQKLKILQSYGVKLSAVELFNEIDWVCFNADLPMDRTANATEIARVAAKYSALLPIARQLVNRYYPGTKLISFGSANGFYDGPVGISSFKPAELYRQLAPGSLSLLDGIGMHSYHSPDDTRKELGAWAALEKPLWVTEWGTVRGDYSSPTARRDDMAQVASILRQSTNPVVAVSCVYELTDRPGQHNGVLGEEASQVFSLNNFSLVSGVPPEWLQIISLAYPKFLGRAFRPGEADGWAAAAPRTLDTFQADFQSYLQGSGHNEWRGVVDAGYRLALGRDPWPGEADGWYAMSPTTLDRFLAKFDEWLASSGAATEWPLLIGRVYRNALGRDPYPNELTTWLGQPPQRADLFDATFRQYLILQRDTEYVQVVNRALTAKLRRAPTAIETNAIVAKPLTYLYRELL